MTSTPLEPHALPQAALDIARDAVRPNGSLTSAAAVVAALHKAGLLTCEPQFSTEYATLTRISDGPWKVLGDPDTDKQRALRRHQEHESRHFEAKQEGVTVRSAAEVQRAAQRIADLEATRFQFVSRQVTDWTEEPEWQ